MKLLNSSELADYIKMRQVHDVRSLKQGQGVVPKLVVSQEVAKQLAGLKEYAADLELDLEISKTAETDLAAATVLAMDWLLAGYNVNLPRKNIVVIKDGLADSDALISVWQSQELHVGVTSQDDDDFETVVKEAEVIVCSFKIVNKLEKLNLDSKVPVASIDLASPLLVCALAEGAIRAAG